MGENEEKKLDIDENPQVKVTFQFERSVIFELPRRIASSQAKRWAKKGYKFTQ